MPLETHILLNREFGGKELQYALIFRVPGSEASVDEGIHIDRSGQSSLRQRFQILVLLLLPRPGFLEGVLPIFEPLHYTTTRTSLSCPLAGGVPGIVWISNRSSSVCVSVCLSQYKKDRPSRCLEDTILFDQNGLNSLTTFQRQKTQKGHSHLSLNARS